MAMINAIGAMDNVMGYSYFGARYYDSDLSVWLSVDPMSDKYPGISPFAYCFNNPIRFSDPFGLEGEDEVAPAGYTKHTDANGGNLYLPSGSSVTTYSKSTATGVKTHKTYNVTQGGVASFTTGEGEEAKTYNAMFSTRTGKLTGYKTSSGEVYNNPTGMQSDGTVAKIGFGETRGLYPSSDGSKVGYDPKYWDYDMAQQLMEARGAIEIVAKRNPKTHPGAVPSSNPNNAEYLQRPYAISQNFPSVSPSISSDPNVAFFYLATSPTYIPGNNYVNQQTHNISIAKSYGPFYNANKSGSLGGAAVYIIFYRVTDK